MFCWWVVVVVFVFLCVFFGLLGSVCLIFELAINNANSAESKQK